MRKAVGPTTVSRWDLLWAAAAGGTAFGVYLRTLAPGMVADVDSPMFQFIGRVLGVAHNPGYPLYVLLTYPFSFVPIGSLAYRINLFSAICGALTVALVFLVARRLGCRRIVGVAAALGMAFGHIFWSQAVVAEVYTLDTAIIAAIVLALLAWGETGAPWRFYAAIGLLAAGFGNHTTIVGFAFGMAVFAWMTDRRFVTRVRHLVATAAILLLGVLQYGFILVRSRTPGAYVESPASTLGELLGVVAGRQFADRLFTFSWREVVFDRLPWFVEQILVPELTIPGLVLAVAGAVHLLRRRPAEAALLLPGGLAIVAFGVNYTVVDLPVFFIPATLVLWLTAAVGGEQLARVVSRAPAASAAVGLALLALPIWQLSQNFGTTDRRHDTNATVTFGRLFDALPDRTAVVREDFLVDRMVQYKLLGERSAHGRRIDLVGHEAPVVRQRLEHGDRVIAFQTSASRLRFDAFDFSFAPMALLDDVVPAVLARLPKGRVVTVAVPAAFGDRFVAGDAAPFRGIGGGGALPPDPSSALIAVGVTGVDSGALVARGPAWNRVAIGAGDPIGSTGVLAPAAVEIETTPADAVIRQGGRDIVRSAEGAVMAIWLPDGQLEQASVLQAHDDFRVPIPSGPLSVYPLRGVWQGQDIGTRWTSMTPMTGTGSVMFRVPGQSTMVAYVADEAPLEPRVVDRSSPEVDVIVTPVSALDLTTLLGETAPLAVHVYRIEVRSAGPDDASVLMALGGVPSHAMARVEQGGAAATIFSVDTTGLLRTPDRSSEVLLMARDDQQQLTGAGWSAVDWDSVSPFRWMIDPRAYLLLPIAQDRVRSIRVQALREGVDAPSGIRLLLNGHDLGSRALVTGWQPYEWPIPVGLARRGTNSATLVVDRLPAVGLDGAPVRGLAVSDLRVVHEPVPE